MQQKYSLRKSSIEYHKAHLQALLDTRLKLAFDITGMIGA